MLLFSAVGDWLSYVCFLGPAQGHSPELCVALRTLVLPDCQDDELALCQQFDQPDQNRKWREGVIKSSFNYLLLDPRSVVIVWLFQRLNESFLASSHQANHPGPSPPMGWKKLIAKWWIWYWASFLNNVISLSMFLFLHQSNKEPPVSESFHEPYRLFSDFHQRYILRGQRQALPTLQPSVRGSRLPPRR